MASRSLAFLLFLSFLVSSAAFVALGVFSKSNRSGALNLARSSGHHATYRSSIRPPIRCAAEGMMGGDEEGDDDEVDESAEGVAKMRVKEIKAELDLRGVGYAGVFEKAELVEKLVEARSLGKANPSIVDEFNKENLEAKFDPERAAQVAADLLDQEKLKDMTAADGTLPGGLTPDQLAKFVSNPDIMLLMQNPKMQEVMKKVMTGGPSALESLQNDPETSELLKNLEKAMSSVR